MEIEVEVCLLVEADDGYRRAQNEQLLAILRILRTDSDTSGNKVESGGMVRRDSASIGLTERRRSK